MFSSTIIPTINRATLSHTVQSVLDQTFSAEDFEVIVVNDSGKPLADAPWQHSRGVRVINTNRRERSVARNTGAAIALGNYFHFLDDDDVLLPGAMNAFWELAQKASKADWLYGSWRTVDNDGNLVAEFHPELSGNIFAQLASGEGLPLQASLLKAGSFFQIGAYDPDPTLIGVEDRDIGRRMALHGSIAYTPSLIAQVRIGEAGSSTNWKVIASADQWGREKVLRSRNAFRRVHASATTSYWRGRASRAYFASMIWNLRRHSPMIAFGRLMAALAITSLYPFSKGYWEGMRNLR